MFIALQPRRAATSQWHVHRGTHRYVHTSAHCLGLTDFSSHFLIHILLMSAACVRSSSTRICIYCLKLIHPIRLLSIPWSTYTCRNNNINVILFCATLSYTSFRMITHTHTHTHTHPFICCLLRFLLLRPFGMLWVLLKPRFHLLFVLHLHNGGSVLELNNYTSHFTLYSFIRSGWQAHHKNDRPVVR